MLVELEHARGRPPDLAGHWRALSAPVAPSIFQTREWLETWSSVFGESREFWNVVVREDDRIRAIAPLMLQRVARGHRELQLAAATHADYADFLYRDSPEPALAAIARELAGRAADWDSFYVRNVPTQSPTCAALRAAMRGAGLYCFHESLVPAPALVFEAEDGAGLLDKYSVRRAVRRLSAAGSARFQLLEAGGEIRDNLPVFFAQHQQRWQGTATPSPFADPAHRRWFEALAEVMAERGWLHFSKLELDGVPVAFHFGFLHGGRLVWYKPSYDPAYSRLSPGIVLVTHLIRMAVDQGASELDFTIGNEPFKQRFANVVRWNANFRVFHDRGRYGAALAGGALRKAVKAGLGLWRRGAGARVPLARKADSQAETWLTH
jgi:CelD/BcsL family acetyltransferase involved in cellulose biosynthesis